MKKEDPWKDIDLISTIINLISILVTLTSIIISLSQCH